MATCPSSDAFSSTNTLDQDAAAYLQYLHGTLSPTYRDLNANLGFEEDVKFWGLYGGGIFNSPATGGATGPKHAAFYPDDATSYVYQTVRLWTGNDSDVSVRAVVNAERPSAGVQTWVQVQLYWREVFDASPPADPCDYSDGIRNPNIAPSVLAGAWQKKSETDMVELDDDWMYAVTDWYEMQEVHDGHELQIRVRAITSGSHSVRLDNTRLQERGL